MFKVLNPYLCTQAMQIKPNLLHCLNIIDASTWKMVNGKKGVNETQFSLSVLRFSVLELKWFFAPNSFPNRLKH